VAKNVDTAKTAEIEAFAEMGVGNSGVVVAGRTAVGSCMQIDFATGSVGFAGSGV
jgi:hypothetical protein